LFPSSRTSKVLFLKIVCSLSINIWRIITVKHHRWHETLLTLSYLVNHVFNTSLFIELLIHPRRPDSTCPSASTCWVSCGIFQQLINLVSYIFNITSFMICQGQPDINKWSQVWPRLNRYRPSIKLSLLRLCLSYLYILTL
jgi:hypothetical protein